PGTCSGSARRCSRRSRAASPSRCSPPPTSGTRPSGSPKSSRGEPRRRTYRTRGWRSSTAPTPTRGGWRRRSVRAASPTAWRERVAGVARLVAELRARFGESDPATVLEAVIDVVGYEQYLAEEGAEGIERLDNVRELVAGAAEWAEEAATDGDEAGEEGRGER